MQQLLKKCCQQLPKDDDVAKLMVDYYGAKGKCDTIENAKKVLGHSALKINQKCATAVQASANGFVRVQLEYVQTLPYSSLQPVAAYCIFIDRCSPCYAFGPPTAASL